MGRTVINIGAVIESARTINLVKSGVGNTRQTFTQTKNSVDCRIKDRSDIRNRLDRVQRTLQNVDVRLGRIRSTVQNGAVRYRDVEANVESMCKQIAVTNIGVSLATKTLKWSQYFKDTINSKSKETTTTDKINTNGVTATNKGAGSTSTTDNSQSSNVQTSTQKQGSSTANSGSVQVPLYGQQTNYTCGSASGSMILNSLGMPCTESQFWNYANANGEGTYVYRIAQTLNHFAGNNVYSYKNTSNMSLDEYYNTISTSITNGYPVEVVVTIPSGTEFGYYSSGHYVVITDVYCDSNGNYIAKINDPYSKNWAYNGHNGQQLEMKLSDLKRYNANHSGFIIGNVTN